jgi:Transposase DDE domain
LSLLDEGFDPSSLVYWRRRLANSRRPHRINDAVRQVIEATGVLAGRRRRAVDSTILDDAVATQDTVTMLVAAIRKVARVVPGGAGAVTAVCGRDYTQPGKPDIDWSDPAAKQALVSDLVNDARALLGHLTGPGSPRYEAVAADALGLLALVAGQDVEPADGSDGVDGRWVIARKVAPDRTISTVDPQARHTRKSRSTLRDGYRAHVAAEPDTGLITDCEMTMATGEDNTDAAMGVTMIHRDRFTTDDADEPSTTTERPAPADTDPTDPTEAGQHEQHSPDSPGGLEVYGDSMYGSGEARAAYRDGHHDTFIKPIPLRPAVPGGFTVDDFTIDDTTSTVTCPAGHTRSMAASRTVAFGRICDTCPLQARCTTSKTGKSTRIHPHEGLLRAARAQARTPQFKQAYPTRANVERTIAQVATQHGRRVKLRHRGTKPNHAWLRTRCAALNLRTLLRLGLTRTARTWTTTPA